jgi:hypothetical protein
MNLPNLPTDNLYKFLALSGITLYIACLVLSVITSQDISDKRMKVSNELIELKKELNSIESSTKDEPTQTTQYKLDIFKSRLDNKQSEVDSLATTFESISQLLYSGYIVGLSSSFLGFILWYFKVQRYEDMILQAQVPKK